MEVFLKLAEMAQFPYISCNFNKEGELAFPAYVIKEFDDVKIGFVGVTTPMTIRDSAPKYFMDENGNYIYGFFQDETGEGVYTGPCRMPWTVHAKKEPTMWLCWDTWGTNRRFPPGCIRM